MKIAINSGFQRGGSLYQWDGATFTLIRRASENTWHDDGDSSFSVEVPDDFRGAIVHFNGVSAYTYVSRVTLLGFSVQEENAPAPQAGHYRDVVGVRAERSVRVATFGDWSTAMLLGSFTLDSAVDLSAGRKHPVSGNVLIDNGYQRGDQRAAGWDIYSPKGEYIGCAHGCGDRTPEPIEGDLDWEFITPVERTMAAWAEEDAEREDAEAEAREEAGLRIEEALSR